MDDPEKVLAEGGGVVAKKKKHPCDSNAPKRLISKQKICDLHRLHTLPDDCQNVEITFWSIRCTDRKSYRPKRGGRDC